MYIRTLVINFHSTVELKKNIYSYLLTTYLFIYVVGMQYYKPTLNLITGTRKEESRKSCSLEIEIMIRVEINL